MLEYSTNISGCNKKCPCRGWLNCPAYVDVTEQFRRLKNKSEETFRNIHDWYETSFRICYEHFDYIGNG